MDKDPSNTTVFDLLWFTGIYLKCAFAMYGHGSPAQHAG